jgi:hypothetical protein
MEGLVPGRPEERRVQTQLPRVIPHCIPRPESSSHIASVPPRSHAALTPIPRSSSPSHTSCPSLDPKRVPITCPACRCVLQRHLPASGARTVTHGNAPSSKTVAADETCAFPSLLLKHPDKHTHNIRLKQIKHLKYSCIVIVTCNTEIYFCNIQIKHLQHESETCETLETYA